MKVIIDERNMPKDHKRFRYEGDVKDLQIQHANI